MSEISLQISPASPEELPFVYSSWLKSFRSSDLAKDIPGVTFFNYHHRLIERILDRAACIMARSEGVIVGYIVFEPGIVHYVYIKQAFRTLGIATSLFKSSGLDIDTCCYTHSTKVGRELAEKNGLSYNPYLL